MRKNKNKPEFDRPSTIISKDTTIETENFTSKSSLQISGEIIGNINVASSLVITETGKVSGNIKAQFVLLSGEVLGNIDVKHLMHITSTGNVHGDIICGTIVVDEAATVNGKCTMLGSKGSVNVKPLPTQNQQSISSNKSLNKNQNNNGNDTEEDDNIFKML